jgi:hypothetical protein
MLRAVALTGYSRIDSKLRLIGSSGALINAKAPQPTLLGLSWGCGAHSTGAIAKATPLIGAAHAERVAAGHWRPVEFP